MACSGWEGSEAAPFSPAEDLYKKRLITSSLSKFCSSFVTRSIKRNALATTAAILPKTVQPQIKAATAAFPSQTLPQHRDGFLPKVLEQ